MNSSDQILNILTPAIEHLGVLGYWLAFLAAMLETTLIVGLFLPGSSLILILGAMSVYGYLDLGDLLWFAIAGAIVGDNINFFLGKKYGSKWAQKGIWFLKQEHFEKARAFFDTHGVKSVFLGRFIPSIKEIMPFIAGTVRMRRRSFMLWNILGGIGWGFEWILAGYIFAQSLNLARMWLSRAGLFMAGLFLVLAVLYVLRLMILKYGQQVISLVVSLGRSIGQAVITNPDIERLINNYPRFFRFIGQRCSREAFTGLPLTLLAIAFFYVLALFGGAVEDYLTGDPIVAADIRISNLMHLFRTDGLTKLFLVVTLLGKWQVVLSFTIAAITTLLLIKKRWYIIPFLLSFAGSEIFTWLGKLALHRPRPQWPVYVEHSYSFPSGHATAAVSFYGFIIYILISSITKWKLKLNLFFAGAIIILLIGFSRIYLGVHFLSDVWSGYLVGAMWLLIGISLSKYLQLFVDLDSTSEVTRRSKFISVLIIVLSFVFYAGYARLYQPDIIVKVKGPVSHQLTVNNVMDIFGDDLIKYTETILGKTQNPINIIIIAKNDNRFVNTTSKAGWHAADKTGVHSITLTIRSLLLDQPYPTAPITPLFWNSRINDFAFEKATTANTIRTRHHVRFWKTKYVTDNGFAIYIGTASFASGIKWGITHKIAPDIDTEREFLYNDLVSTGNVKSARKIHLVEPQAGRNFTGDPYFTDGQAYIITLNPDNS